MAIVSRAATYTGTEIWYVTNDSRDGSAAYGIVNPVTGAWTWKGWLPYNHYSSANAICPSNPDYMYVNWWTHSINNGSGDGNLYRVNLTNSNTTWLGFSPMFYSNRMTTDPTGRIWTVDNNGHLWSTLPTFTSGIPTGIGTPIDYGQIQIANLGPGGDIAFDGLGNLWLNGVIDNGDGTYQSRIYVINSGEIASGNLGATYVAYLGNVSYPGLAFAPSGKLYSETSTSPSQLYEINPVTGITTLVQNNTGSYAYYASDLASANFPQPVISQTKAVSPTTEVAPGDTLTYTITITNTGNLTAVGAMFQDAIPANTTYVQGSTTLNGAAVSDLAGGLFRYSSYSSINSPGALSGNLAPGSTTTITFRVKLNSTIPDNITQITNTGQVDYTGLSGNANTNTVTNLIKRIDLVKSASPTTLPAVGQNVTYTFTVTNTGGVTLTNVTVTDPMFPGGITLNRTTLTPGQVATGTATRTVTQTDIDIGFITNTATADGTPPSGGTHPRDTSSVTINGVRNPLIDLVKTADKTAFRPGDTITYTFTVKNTGNVTLTNVIVTDPMFPGGITINKTTLAPGETATGTASRAVTQADIDAGSITNTAAATGTPPSGLSPPDDTSSVTVPLMERYTFSFYKVDAVGTYPQSNILNAVSGASFTVIDISTGSTLPGVTSDANGLVSIQGLYPDNYRISETILDGYLKNSYDISLVVAADGTMTAQLIDRSTGNVTGSLPQTADGRYYFTNNQAKFSIQKINDAQQSLAGAEFALYQSDGTTIALNVHGQQARGTSDANGIINFTGIKAGAYILKELKAPTGYVISNVDWNVTVSYSQSGDYQVSINGTALGADYNYKIANKIAPEIPLTGGSGTAGFFIFGIALMMGVYLYNLCINNKSKKI